MGYETMGIHERSRHAHIRAGRMVQQLTGNRNISKSYTNGNENYEPSPPVVWLLVSDDQYGQQPQNRDEQIHLDEGVNFVNDFTQIFHHLEQKQWATPDQLETLTQLKLACEEDYIKAKSSRDQELRFGVNSLTAITNNITASVAHANEGKNTFGRPAPIGDYLASKGY